MIAVCSDCGCLYEAGSEEQANEPDRQCRTCWARGVANAHRAMHGMDLLPRPAAMAAAEAMTGADADLVQEDGVDAITVVDPEDTAPPRCVPHEPDWP